jgi:hypothetical protein
MLSRRVGAMERVRDGGLDDLADALIAGTGPVAMVEILVLRLLEGEVDDVAVLLRDRRILIGRGV